MTDALPNDSDGDALRRVLNDGSDLSKPMFVNFQVAVPDRVAANELSDVATKLGYRTRVYPSLKCSLPWTCECSTRMVATYEALIAVQNELAALSRRFGGHPDGWGTFGNKSGGQPSFRENVATGDLDIPASIAEQKDRVEMARIWHVNGRQHMVLNAPGWKDPAAWGLLLADVARLVADSYHRARKRDAGEVLARIKEGIEMDWALKVEGTFGDFE